MPTSLDLFSVAYDAPQYPHTTQVWIADNARLICVRWHDCPDDRPYLLQRWEGTRYVTLSRHRSGDEAFAWRELK